MAAKWFRGKSARKVARQSVDALPDGLWTTCPECNEILFNKDLDQNLRVCNKGGYHYRLTAWERLQITVARGTFQGVNEGVESGTPTDFPD